MKCPCCYNKVIVSISEKYTLQSSKWTSNSSRSTKFFHEPYYCKNCGHIFNKLLPSQQELNQYYSDQVPHITEDYNVDKRLDIIKKFSRKKGLKNLIDFGGNSKVSFHNFLDKDGWEVDIVDVNDSINLKKRNIITSYFVLEHLTKLDETINLFYELLTDDGNIIIEVPNSVLYDIDQSGLLYEHQQHFQPSSLEKLFVRHGFKQCYVSHDKCSRDFGFLSIFEKSKSKVTFSEVNHNVYKNFQIGRKKQIALGEYPKLYFDKISNNTKVIVFWGINAYLDQIFSSIDLTSFKIITIDINPIKKSFVTPKFDFYTPDDFFINFSKIQGDEINIDEICFVITATEHYNTIKNQLTSITDNIYIFDPIGRIKQ